MLDVVVQIQEVRIILIRIWAFSNSEFCMCRQCQLAEIIVSGWQAKCVPVSKEQPYLDYCVQMDIDRLSCICCKAQFFNFIKDGQDSEKFA